ncbi:helix-turn-helix transcriptional regulator, partial [Streptomyces sp. H34-S4]|uniref:helix-turn-helix transcriptional regulator n=1 Tax=Streptomyces sp. H34-S4 TaxID=2996463 RepID=UPI002270B9B9
MSHVHENEQTTLFAAVDALLEEAAAQDALPHPDERKRLREAAGLSQDQIAQALAVRRETVTSWETGRTAPRPPKRAAYARLLNGLSDLHPINAVNAASTPQLPTPEAAATVNAVNTPQGPTPEATSSPTPTGAPVNAVNTAQAPAAEPAGPAPTTAAPINAVNAAPHAEAAEPAAAPPQTGPGAKPQLREGAGRGTAPQGPTPATPHTGTATRTAARSTTTARSTTAKTTPPTPPQGNGPLAVLDGTGKAHTAHGAVLTPPTT